MNRARNVITQQNFSQLFTSQKLLFPAEREVFHLEPQYPGLILLKLSQYSFPWKFMIMQMLYVNIKQNMVIIRKQEYWKNRGIPAPRKQSLLGVSHKLIFINFEFLPQHGHRALLSSSLLVKVLGVPIKLAAPCLLAQSILGGTLMLLYAK